MKTARNMLGKMPVVVYLINQKLTSLNLERFGINYWHSRNVGVIILDVTPLVCDYCYDEKNSKELCDEVCEYVKIGALSDVMKYKNRINRSKYYFDLCYDSERLIPIRMLLALYGLGRVTDKCGFIPGAVRKLSRGMLISKVRDLGVMGTIRRTASICINRIAGPLYKPEFVIASGTQSVNGVAANKLIWAHTYDYDKHLRERCAQKNNGYGAIVFIDQHLCGHEDYKYFNILPSVSKALYYPAVNRFLLEMSQRLNLKVIVSLHPRRNGEIEPGYHKDFIQANNDTYNLIADSSYVVGHNSTALQYAVLLNKKIVFVTTNELNERIEEGDLIYSAADVLGYDVINIDNQDFCWSFIDIFIDKNRYDDYKESYIKSKESEDLPLWQIVDKKLFGTSN